MLHLLVGSMVCDAGKSKALKEVVKDENRTWKGGCFFRAKRQQYP